MKNILVITPTFYSKEIGIDATPVVNYFVKEWGAMGHNVRVIHLPSLFPFIIRCFARPFKRQIEAKFNCTLFLETIHEISYLEDGVPVYRIPLRKTKPHARYGKREIDKAFRKVISYLNNDGYKPDIVIGHWILPTIDLGLKLKLYYNCPLSVTLHSSVEYLRDTYSESQAIVKKVDFWGFRSLALKRQFEEIYGEGNKTFICYSGIPSEYVDSNFQRKYNFNDRFIFVGVLRERKYPALCVEALYNSYGSSGFTMKYIGKGDEDKSIISNVSKFSVSPECVSLLGYMDRSSVTAQLKESDIFIMVSRNEAFGLVYLEAMATGCIPIASRNEGFDGIIIDGYNGFLCEAGNCNELTTIINKIRSMSNSDLQTISDNAISTAVSMTDSQVAQKYLDNIFTF